MKNWIIALIVIAFIMGGCKSRNNYDQAVNNDIKKTEKYRYDDEELDTKSVATVDTIEFRKVMKTLLPTKRILELFGSGYQVFYLGLTIDPEGKVMATLAPDAGWWVTGLGDVERLLFKENLEIAKDFAIIPDSEGDSKAISIKDVFYFPRFNVQKAFAAVPGILNGKKVRSLKIFQIDATIDNATNIIAPWSIKEMNISKFRPQIITNLGREYYVGYFPSVLKDDFKFIGQSMGFPREARARGVSGRVLIKLFFESDGEYAGYQLIKGLGYACDEEVINTIKNFKPKCYPSGQRSTVIVPFKFGHSDKTPVDLTADPLAEQNPTKYNNLFVKWFSKIKIKNPIKTSYKVIININNKIVSIGMYNVGYGDGALSFRWKPEKPGAYNYLISIDPENVLNDIDRSNNTIKGKLVIK